MHSKGEKMKKIFTHMGCRGITIYFSIEELEYIKQYTFDAHVKAAENRDAMGQSEDQKDFYQAEVVRAEEIFHNLDKIMHDAEATAERTRV